MVARRARFRLESVAEGVGGDPVLAGRVLDGTVRLGDRVLLRDGTAEGEVVEIARHENLLVAELEEIFTGAPLIRFLRREDVPAGPGEDVYFVAPDGECAGGR